MTSADFCENLQRATSMRVCRVSSGSCGNNAESGMLRTLKLVERISTGVTFEIWETVGGTGVEL